MSRPRNADGRAPRQRCCLPRQLVRKTYDFRPNVVAVLQTILRMDELQYSESEVAAIERLILSEGDRLSRSRQ
jgi:hypothetical protein